jgi:hypothetical protein
MKSIVRIVITTAIAILLLSGCTPKKINGNDKTITSKEELENTLVEIAKQKYDSIQYDDGLTILLSLEDMEKVYKLDISKFKDKKLGCDLKMSYVKIEVKNKEKTYTTNLNCSGFIK